MFLEQCLETSREPRTKIMVDEKFHAASGATLDAEKFQRCFVAWVAALTGTSADVIAIDGNALRRSYQKKKGAKAPIQ